MAQEQHQEPIKYGDVFDVHGDLASKVIAPQDAKSMQASENQTLGETPRGGPASVMLSAATVNARAGFVDSGDISDEVREKGTTVSASNVGGDRVVTESVACQVVAQYIEPRVARSTPGALGREAVTIGEALKAAAMAAGDKPLDQSDAAAIQAAEVRATGLGIVLPGGIGAQAQSAATCNLSVALDKDKTTIGDVLGLSNLITCPAFTGDATEKLPGDEAVNREDAERVIKAEVRNKPETRATSGVVASAMAAAANLNYRTQP